MRLTLNTAAAPGVYIAFAMALYVWHVAAALLGAFIADRLGVSDGGGLKGDLKKLSLCSLIALSLFFPLFYFAQTPAVFIVYLLAFLFSLKMAYLGANHGFLLVILGAVLAGMAAFVPVVGWLKLPGIFFLYLFFSVALLIRWQAERRRRKEIAEVRQRKARDIRERFRRDRSFATPCHQCLFHRLADQRCQLKIDGDDVGELAIDQRTFCLAFRQAPPGRPE